MGSLRPRRTLLVASLGFFLITLDILIVTVALTRIGRDLGGGTAGQQWVIDGYTLIFASLLLFAGNLSDRIGAKPAFASGIALFLLASVACAVAPTLGTVIATGFGAAVVIVALAVAAVGAAAFLAIQARGRHPMMPLDLFRSSGMRISLGIGFSFMVANFGSVFVGCLYLQQQLGLSPLLAGLVFLPCAAFSVTGNIVSGTLANRFGPRVPVRSGLGCMAIGLIALLLTAPSDNPLLVGVFLILTGTGGAVSMPQVASVVLASGVSPK